MSPPKRQPSKQKRTAQNRQQRAALEARKAAAGSAGGGGGSGARSSARGTSVLGRLFGGGGGGGGTRAAGPRAGAGIGAPRGDQPVGFRAALAGLLAAVAAIILTVLQTTPVDAEGDLYTPEKLVAEWSDSALAVAVDQPDADADAVAEAVEEWSPGRGSERLIQALWPASVAMALPVLAAFLAFRAVQQRRPSRTVNRAMYATLFGALLTFNLFIFFLPSVVANSIAGFQVRMAEATAAALAAAEAGEAGGDGDVIDAEVVDEAEPTTADADDDLDDER